MNITRLLDNYEWINLESLVKTKLKENRVCFQKTPYRNSLEACATIRDALIEDPEDLFFVSPSNSSLILTGEQVLDFLDISMEAMQWSLIVGIKYHMKAYLPAMSQKEEDSLKMFIDSLAEERRLDRLYEILVYVYEQRAKGSLINLSVLLNK